MTKTKTKPTGRTFADVVSLGSARKRELMQECLEGAGLSKKKASEFLDVVEEGSYSSPLTRLIAAYLKG